MDFTGLISQLGFPIACCCVLGWYIYHLEEIHRKEVDGLRETIENNTEILSTLVNKLNEVLK